MTNLKILRLQKRSTGLIKNFYLFIPKSPGTMSNVQEKPSARKKEHQHFNAMPYRYEPEFVRMFILQI
jgi:hypothetical protein